MADRENYFILLELPFDPPVSDEKVILDALTAKHQQWARDRNNPIKAVQAAEYLSRFEEIKAFMLDPDKRREEAADAKKIRESKRKDLDDKLTLLASRSPELTKKDLVSLLKLFGSFGFSEEEIRRRFGEITASKEDSKIDVGDIIDPTLAATISERLNKIGLQEGSLYDVLEMSPDSSPSALCSKAANLRKTILGKGTKISRETEISNLCELCPRVFENQDSKRKYDNYLKLTRYTRVNAAVDEAAKTNKLVITPEIKDSLIDIAFRNYNISPSEASSYISNYCMLKGYQEKSKSVVCGLCGTENPGGASVCIKCGKPLFVICPSCGTQNGNALTKCAKCGFDLTKTDKALELIRQAKILWNGRKPDEAEAALREANLFWPGHKDIVALQEEIQSFRGRFGDILKEITRQINEKKFYGAQISINKAQNEGFVIDSSIVSGVQAVIRDVEAKLAKVRSMSEDDAFEVVLSLTKEVSDSEETNRLITKYPPSAPSAVQFSLTPTACVLKWAPSSSSGIIEYLLVRKTDMQPNDPSDGKVIYQGRDLSYTDASIQKSTVYYYAVFAVRASVCSPAARTAEAAVLVDNVTDIRAICGDGLVTLAWTKPETAVQVNVFLAQGDRQPDSPSAYRDTKNERLDGAAVSGLVNGQKYWFGVRALHRIDGKVYPSNTAFISAIPQKPAAPISNLRITYQDDIFRVVWDKAEWNVIMFHSDTKPDYAPGVTYDYEALRKKYHQIELNQKSLTEAEFTLIFIGECYIIPGQISSSNVILNEPCHISSVPAMKDPSYDVNASRTELYVNFTWPKRIENSLLIYRQDDFPKDYNDPLGKKIECSKKQYQSNEGILVTNPPAGNLYALIYSYFQNAAGRIYSEPVRLGITNEPQREIYYSVKYKKSLFSKKRSFTVTFRGTGSFVLPSFCIVGKMRSIPLNRSDGFIICSVENETNISGTYTFEFDPGDLQKDLKLKAFFMNDKHYKNFKLIVEGPNVIT